MLAGKVVEAVAVAIEGERFVSGLAPSGYADSGERADMDEAVCAGGQRLTSHILGTLDVDAVLYLFICGPVGKIAGEMDHPVAAGHSAAQACRFEDISLDDLEHTWGNGGEPCDAVTLPAGTAEGAHAYIARSQRMKQVDAEIASCAGHVDAQRVFLLLKSAEPLVVGEHVDVRLLMAVASLAAGAERLACGCKPGQLVGCERATADRAARLAVASEPVAP